MGLIWRPVGVYQETLIYGIYVIYGIYMLILQHYILF